jgi:hypothetical protein
VLRLLLLFLVGFSGPFLAVVWPKWVNLRDGMADLADAHVSHEVAHPGWSFPARVWSAPAPLDLPVNRRIAHALARGYARACPAQSPGQV